MGARGVCLLLLLLVGVGACGDNAAGPFTPLAGPGKFGDRCGRTEDCASALCIRVDASGGVCTTTCSERADCPKAPNWGCIEPQGLDAKVCACLPNSAKEICEDLVDNDCDGRTDDCRICSGRQVAEDDPAHCGRCDNACRSNQLCENGNCHCRAGTVECSGTCADTSTSAQHCGACGNACGANQECRNGSCVCTDTRRPDHCPGSGCTSLADDPDNCGTCGNACGFGQTCVQGKCDCPAATHTVCGSECVILDSDEANCGSCGKACAPGEVCESGACVCKSKLSCGGTCIPVDDVSNCGACGKVCSQSQTCKSGQCVCVGSGLTPCGDSCVPLSYDVSNCGRCGNACRSTEQCTNGVCECPSGYSWCEAANACVNLYDDATHCGNCATVCRNGEVCSSGTCACPNFGDIWCASANRCVKPYADSAHCGGCDIACRASETCTFSGCGCPEGGQAWCASAGSCVDTRYNPNHCGGCDKKCRTGEVCSNGACTCLNPPEKWCAAAGTCVDTSSSSAHCGDCDRACPAQTHCGSGACTCDQAGLSLCGSSCVDLQTDENHCNTCDNACSGNFQCMGGACRCPDPLLGAEVRLTNDSIVDNEPAVAWDGTHVALAYIHGDRFADGANVMFALLNPDGTYALAPVPLTSFNPSGTAGVVSEPSIAWTGSEYAVAWAQHVPAATPPAFAYTAMLQRVSAAGSPIGAPVSMVGDGAGYVGSNPRVTWSQPYGGYAIMTVTTGNTLRFQRRGPLGTTEETPNDLGITGVPNTFIALPGGGWGVAASNGPGCMLIQINADGSRTQPVSNVTGESGCDLVWDGTTYAMSWAARGTTTNGEVWINRGQQRNAPTRVVSLNVPNVFRPIDYTRLAVGPGSTLTVAYNLAATTAGFGLQLSRFSLPASIFSPLTPITNTSTVLASDNIPVREKFRVVGTGNNLLAIWVDNRWGERELYARPIDLRGCP